MVAKGEFEPGLSRLRVWHSTAELLRYLSGMYNIREDLPMVKVTPATRANSRMTANTDASTMVNWSCVRSTGTDTAQCIGHFRQHRHLASNFDIFLSLRHGNILKKIIVIIIYC